MLDMLDEDLRMKRDGVSAAIPHLPIFFRPVLIMIVREVSGKRLLRQLLLRPLW